jgi:hypothetical protein
MKNFTGAGKKVVIYNNNNNKKEKKKAETQRERKVGEKRGWDIYSYSYRNFPRCLQAAEGDSSYNGEEGNFGFFTFILVHQAKALLS